MLGADGAMQAQAPLLLCQATFRLRSLRQDLPSQFAYTKPHTEDPRMSLHLMGIK